MHVSRTFVIVLSCPKTEVNVTNNDKNALFGTFPIRIMQIKEACKDSERMVLIYDGYSENLQIC
jgi:hypothetical protein